jgi:hypothetical protein
VAGAELTGGTVDASFMQAVGPTAPQRQLCLPALPKALESLLAQDTHC